MKKSLKVILAVAIAVILFASPVIVPLITLNPVKYPSILDGIYGPMYELGCPLRLGNEEGIAVINDGYYTCKGRGLMELPLDAI